MEMYRFLKPAIMEGSMKSLFWKTMTLLLLSKSLTIVSPYFLKLAVNALSIGESVNLMGAFMAIGAFGAARTLSTVLGELRMNQV